MVLVPFIAMMVMIPSRISQNYRVNLAVRTIRARYKGGMRILGYVPASRCQLPTVRE
jgi:hypothetical protein